LQRNNQVNLQRNNHATLQRNNQANLQCNNNATLQRNNNATLQRNNNATLQHNNNATLQRNKNATFQHNNHANRQQIISLGLTCDQVKINFPVGMSTTVRGTLFSASHIAKNWLMDDRAQLSIIMSFCVKWKTSGANSIGISEFDGNSQNSLRILNITFSTKQFSSLYARSDDFFDTSR
jgi:hypothetical protein